MLRNVSVMAARVLRHGVIIYTVTFLFILPIVCYNKTFSFYFKLRDRKQQNVINGLIQKRNQAVKDAEVFFRTFDQGTFDTRLSGPGTTGNRRSNVFGTNRVPDIAVGIISVKREVFNSQYSHFQPKYVLEVTARLLQVLERMGDDLRTRITVFICNPQSDPDTNDETIMFLSNYVRTIHKKSSDNKKPWTSNRHDQEKNDYAFCLREMSKFGAKYTLILQDDAVIHWDFFDVLMHILGTKIEHRYERGELVKANASNLAYVKLYFPEKWQGFAWELRQMTELLVIGIAGGTILTLIYEKIICRPINSVQLRIFVLSLAILYCILVALSINRQNLMMVRRVSPHLYYIRDSPHCCIPAVLYSQGHIRDIVQYLESPDLTCHSNFPLDVAIGQYVDKLGLDAFLIEPNLVDHIGLFSTLHRGPKDPASFFEI
ncbi:post-GPI attachment to proteins factor 4-like [Ptychodera flava]|uniref:post-GPI attachment to proteins factor 4-like n=1 Tax=Ptychodera flava TaxID=63121 RepID=UPI00396A78F2